MDRRMQWLGIGAFVKVDSGACYTSIDIRGDESEGSVEHSRHVGIATQIDVTERNLLKDVEVARIELQCLLQIAGRRIPISLSPLDVALEFKDLGVVR